MKVKPVVANEFQPFTITVESQAEADLIIGLLGAVPNNVAEFCGVAPTEAYNMYNTLYKYRTPTDFPAIISLID